MYSFSSHKKVKSEYQLEKLAKQKKPLLSKRLLYPEPESNRHGFPQVFETSASTNSAIRANCSFGISDLFLKKIKVKKSSGLSRHKITTVILTQ